MGTLFPYYVFSLWSVIYFFSKMIFSNCVTYCLPIFWWLSTAFRIKTCIISLDYIPWLLSNFLGSAALGITPYSLCSLTLAFFPWLLPALLSVSYPEILHRLFLLPGVAPSLPSLLLSILQIRNTSSMKKKSQWPLSHMLTFGQILKLLVTLNFFSSLI